MSTIGVTCAFMVSCAVRRMARNRPLTITKAFLGVKVFIVLRVLKVYCIVGLSFWLSTTAYTWGGLKKLHIALGHY